MIEVAEARTAQDRDAIFRLRYAIYVEEMGRTQRHADHALRTVVEPDDEQARLLLARDAAGRVVGAARVHLGPLVPPTLATLYQMQRFAPFFPLQTSTTTKLMVDVRFRRTPMALRLAQACYNMGLNAGMSFNFIDCNAHLRPFFSQLGFRQVFPEFTHPEYGSVTPMVLALRDVGYLRRIRSPLLQPDAPDTHESVAFFEALHRQSLSSLAPT